MTLEEARKRLAKARIKAKKLNAEMQILRQVIIKAGSHPDIRMVGLEARNKKIFKEWNKGNSFTAIGKKFQLSPTRISSICRMIESCLVKQKGEKFKRYKSLLKIAPKL